MSYHVGFLYLTDWAGNPVEIINEARTAANMQRGIGTGQPYYSDVLRNGGCDGLAFEPCSVAPDGTVTSWAALNTDLTEAPWYNGSEAWRAKDAHGFIIEEWTGLDASHMKRQLVSRGSRPYGGAPGLQTQTERVMKINVIAVGASADGLQYLFRWLESTLVATCSQSATTSLYLRETCPEGSTVTELEDGLVRLDQAVLIEGPMWESPPVEDAGCHVRRISFTIAAGDPCMHRVPSAATAQAANYVAIGSPTNYDAGCRLFASSNQRLAANVPVPAYGLASAVVTITTTWAGYAPLDFSYAMPAMRILGVVNYFDRTGSVDPCIQPIIGKFTLDNMRDGWEYRINCATGESIGRPLFNSRDWVDTSFIIQNNADYDTGYTGLRNFSFTNCAAGAVIVEPALTGTISRYIGDFTGYVTGWSMSIQPTSRFGCI